MLSCSILSGWEDPPKVSTPSTQSVILPLLCPAALLLCSAVSGDKTGSGLRNNYSLRKLPVSYSGCHLALPAVSQLLSPWSRSSASVCSLLSLSLRSGEMWARLTRWGRGDLSETTLSEHAISSASLLLQWLHSVLAGLGTNQRPGGLPGVIQWALSQSSSRVLLSCQPRSSSWRPATPLANFLYDWV